MPNCFQLVRKSDTNAGPVVLQQIDDEMREAFHEPPDTEHWYRDWYNWAGLYLALGKTFDQIREIVKDDVQGLRIVEWLDANFTSSAWFSHR